MSDPGSLRRLHDIREAEEDQRRVEMEAALAELRRLEHLLENARQRGKLARSLLVAGVQSVEPIDRLAALQEITTAERLKKILAVRIGAAEARVIAVREELLNKRTERRQVEALLDATRAQEKVEANRRSQAALDDWHSSQRMRRKKLAR